MEVLMHVNSYAETLGLDYNVDENMGVFVQVPNMEMLSKLFTLLSQNVGWFKVVSLTSTLIAIQ